jgi:hypothetical protein
VAEQEIKDSEENIENNKSMKKMRMNLNGWTSTPKKKRPHLLEE